MRLSKPRISPLQDDEMNDEQREALQPMAQGGRVINIFRTLARAPKALTRFQQWGGYVLSRRNSLPTREREIVILRVGFLCKSGYEFTQHTAIGMREGLTATRSPPSRPAPTPAWTAAEQALIRAADELRRRLLRQRRDLGGARQALRREAVHGRGLHGRPVHPGLDVPEQLRRPARARGRRSTPI